jgi:hypothetical protein
MNLLYAFANWIGVTIKVKLWFATVNKYRGWKAKRKLAAYVKTLSPAQQVWANDLRKKLDHSPVTATAAILRGAASDIEIKQARLTEKLERARQP